MITAVLNRFESNEAEVRLEAADAFSGFAFAVLSHPRDARGELVVPLSHSLRSHVGSAFTKYNEDNKAHRLMTLSMAPLGCSDTPLFAQEVIRALVVLANVIVIMGPDVFTDKASLKLVFKMLEHRESRKLRSMRLLHALIWQCLVWAFTELRVKEPPSSKVRRKALELVKQERRNGVATMLINSLLGPPLMHVSPKTKHHNVQESVAVLRSMTEDGDAVRAEARAILSRLTSAIGSAPTPPSTPAVDGNFFGGGMLAKELFDGTILRASDERLLTLLQTLAQFSTERVRPLTEPEIVESWDGLIEAWTALVKKDIVGCREPFAHPVR